MSIQAAASHLVFAAFEGVGVLFKNSWILTCMFQDYGKEAYSCHKQLSRTSSYNTPRLQTSICFRCAIEFQLWGMPKQTLKFIDLTILMKPNTEFQIPKPPVCCQEFSIYLFIYFPYFGIFGKDSWLGLDI